MKYFVYVKNLKNNLTSSFPNAFTSKKKAIEFADKWLSSVERQKLKLSLQKRILSIRKEIKNKKD
ncbi:hypothetical protein J6W34_09385 [bacterium]|nr:hypothetical protein [bacterium]